MLRSRGHSSVAGAVAALVSVLLLVSAIAVGGPAGAAPGSPGAPTAGAFVSVVPARLRDTPMGTGAPVPVGQSRSRAGTTDTNAPAVGAPGEPGAAPAGPPTAIAETRRSTLTSAATAPATELCPRLRNMLAALD